MIGRLLGDEIDPRLRGVLGVNLAGTAAISALFAFAGIWALTRLHASEGQLGLMYLCSATTGAIGGYVGGHLSDHIGRRPLILVGYASNASIGVLLIAVGTRLWLALAVFIVAIGAASVGGAADQAILTDLVPPDQHERAFAAQRVASNLGAAFGPLVGAALLLLGWSALFAGVSLLTAGATVLAWRFIPERGEHAPAAPPDRSSWSVIRRDRLFGLFIGASCLSWLVYAAYETLMPISLVSKHGLRPATWGVLLVINPVLVTLVQLRLTRRTAGVREIVKLPFSCVLMAGPFLLLTLSASVPVVVVVLVLFVIGEMLWVPAAQSVVVRLAPEDLRGAYLGAFGGAPSVAFAMTPLLGLQILRTAGDSAMWIAVAGVGGAGALLYAVVLARPGLRRSDPALRQAA